MNLSLGRVFSVVALILTVVLFATGQLPLLVSVALGCLAVAQLL